MLKKILTGFAFIILALVIVVAVQPDDFTVTRSATMEASSAEVFAQVNDFHKWQEWSPWSKLDPEAKNTFEGPSSGVGAIMRWAGNMQVGEGSSTIVESRPNEFVKIALEFLKPLKGSNTAEFTIKPEGGKTSVTWSMYGKKNFMSKAIGLVIDCEKMVGEQFEQGLTNLKSVVEAK